MKNANDAYSEKAMIRKRRAWAANALKAFREICPTDPDCELQDLLTNLHHWADKNGFDFEEVLEKSEWMYREEIAYLKREEKNA